VTRAVLDASAVLTLLHDEPGASEVTPWIAEGVISAVNLAEVIGQVARGGDAEATGD
jgi:PIN domain nuclease of toxin-antitoxin system